MANEKRLIDANEPIKATESTINLLKQQNLPTEAHETFLRWLKNFPTVDAVEVDEYIKLREQYDKIFLEYHELRDNFISYVCSGIPNPSPFCLNKRKGCCDCYGWCKNNDKCKGFNPAEVILDGAKMNTVQVMAPGGQKYHNSCSVCGWLTRLHNLNYCPNCGAKMDGDGNG